MTWSLETSNGNESAKIRYEILPYVRGLGLDLGCGPWKVYPHVIGIDANIYPGASGGPNFCGDVADLHAFADGAYDWVYSSHTLEDQDDYRAVLATWWRKVKVGGYLILYLPHRDFYPNVGQPGANPAHKHDFVPADIIAAMQAIGDWDLIECQERNERNEYSFLQIFRKLADGAGCAESWRDPKPAKTAAVVRYGAIGDALWASSLFPQLKAEGYHITVYTQEAGEEAVRHDPHVDRIIIHSDYLTQPGELMVYCEHERPKYDRFINLTHSVEGHMLPAVIDPCFHWDDEVRRAMWSHVNYLERIYTVSQMPFVNVAVRFYPTDDEREWAKAKRAEFHGDVVVLNPVGSTWPKFWPYTAELVALLAKRGVHCVVLGNYRGDPPALDPKYGHFVGMDWEMRQALAFAALADVVVGEESAIVNAVSYESMLKVVLLSHSTPTNLTRDWVNTAAIEPHGLPCYPCHRLHQDSSKCIVEKKVTGGAAACQALILPGAVVEVIDAYLKGRDREAA